MTKKTTAKGKNAKPARGGKGRGRSMNITLPVIMGGLLRFFGLLLLLLWRGLCKITPPLPTWQRMAKSRVTHRVAAGVLMVVVCLIALAVMRGSLAQSGKWQLDPARIQFDGLQLDWISGDGETTIRRMIDASLRDSLAGLEPDSAFESTLAEAVGVRLAANPWVHTVDRVERRFPGDNTPSSLVVSLRLHRPVLRVPLNGRVYLVSRGTQGAAHVLPWAPVLENRIPKHPDDQVAYAGLSPTVRLVSGVWGDAPVPGKTWDSEQLRAAISMEEELRRNDFEAWFPISAIDVLDVARAKRWDGQVEYIPLGGVRLVGKTTGSGLPVVWGKPPVHASTVELPIATKIRKLKDALALDQTLQTYAPELALNQ